MNDVTTTPVPLVDLAWQHREIAEEIVPRMIEVMERGSFIKGPDVARFEAEFAAYCGVDHCVGVGNGTDAIELALRAVGLPAGTDVVLPANTFIATAEAVVRAGGRPVLVDCDGYGLIDVDQVADRLERGAGAVIPVHLYGQMADMEALHSLASRHGSILIEDAAQAQGATRHGHGIGYWGDAAATSFYPGKNLGAYGDAGAVVSRDETVAQRIRVLADHGSDRKYLHSEIGCNSRLDTLHAVVLRAKLARLSGWNDLRRAAADRYTAALKPLRAQGRVELPAIAPGNEHVWHLYVVRVAERDSVLERLHAQGIGAGIHYPVPVHRQDAFAHLGQGPGSFPRAERMASEMVTLPLFPGIDAAVQDRVVEVLADSLVGELAPSGPA